MEIRARESGEHPIELIGAQTPAATNRDWARRRRYKRVFDLLLAAPATLVLLPLFAALAVLIRIESPGPAFFRQERIGRDGTRFRIWKFRSMRYNNDELRHRDAATAWFAGDGTGGQAYKSLSDPRITSLGRLLRRTSLDELPQLFNVVRGDMSLVGPRPAIGYELDLYQPWYFERQRVKPGMTGLWQVSGRSRLSAREMMELDIMYVRECGLLLDLKILLRTIPVIVGRSSEGA